MSSAFDTFVNKQNQPTDNTAQQQQKEQWINHINVLYAQLKDYLQPYLAEGKIHVDVEACDIEEQFLGSYTAPSLKISFAGSNAGPIHVFPKGLHVIAAKGRVDIDGPSGTAMLVRVPESSNGQQIMNGEASNAASKKSSDANDIVYVWKFVAKNPLTTYIPLTKENFQEVIMNVAGS
jgi:hypothetical protein